MLRIDSEAMGNIETFEVQAFEKVRSSYSIRSVIAEQWGIIADLQSWVLVNRGHSGMGDSRVAITLGISLAVDCVIAMLIATQKGRQRRRCEGPAATLQ